MEAQSKDLDLPQELEYLKDFIPDLRVDPSVRARYATPHERASIIESIREGVGLMKFASQAVEVNYCRIKRLLEKKMEVPEGDARGVLIDTLYRLEGVIHVLVTLSRELDSAWRILRGHELWEIQEEERKRIRLEKAREARKRKKEEKAQGAEE